MDRFTWRRRGRSGWSSSGRFSRTDRSRFGLRKRGRHGGGDYFLSAETVAVSYGEGAVGGAAFQELDGFGFVGGAEAVDEFGDRAVVIGHRKGPVFDGRGL